MTWMRKYTATMVPRDTRLKKLQLVIDEQSTMRSKRDSVTLLVKRKLREHYVLLNHPQTLQEWHTTRHTFHSEIGARSVLRVVDEVLRTDECRNSRRITCSFEQWQTAKLSHVSPFVEARSFMCARKGGYEDLAKEILRHFEAYGFLSPVIIQCDKRDEYH